MSKKCIAALSASLLYVFLCSHAAAQYIAVYRIKKPGSALSAPLPQPFQASIDSFYKQAMTSGGTHTLTISYLRSESDSTTGDSLFVKKLKDDIDRRSYLQVACGLKMTEVILRTSQAASPSKRYKQRPSRFVINYESRTATFELDRVVSCYKVSLPDSFIETGRRKQIGKWVCNEYKISGDTAIKLWISPVLDKHVNPGLYCPLGGIVQVDDVNGSRLTLTSVSKRRLPDAKLTCSNGGPDSIRLADRLHRILN